MRRYIWGVVLVLLVAALVSQTIYARKQMKRQAYEPDVSVDQNVLHIHEAGRPVQIRTQVRSEKAPKARNWLKASMSVQPEADEPPPTVWKATIESQPLPKPLAVEDFLDMIRAKLTHELNLTHPPSREWVNDERYIVKLRMDETKPLSKADELIGEVVRLKGEVELTQDGWKDLVRIERKDRSDERLELAARGLGLLTVLLGAVAGYIRIDEWTKGYYSKRLFLAASLLVGIAFLVLVRPM